MKPLTNAGTQQQPPEMAFSLFAVLPPGLDGRQAGIIQTGMTLRDYFAACAVSYRVVDPSDIPPSTDQEVKVIARWAYKLADAMMEARSNGKA